MAVICLSGSVSNVFAGGKKAAEDKNYSGYRYVELDPISVPVIDSNGVSQVVNLVVALEVKELSMVAKAERLEPRLKDAFIQDMYGTLARQSANRGGMLPLPSIKKRLLAVSNRILADEKRSVNDVLLQMLQQRRI